MASIKTKAMEDQERVTKMKAVQAVAESMLKEATPVPKSALQLAHEIVHGDREKTYGSPDKNLNTIAQYWSIHLSASLGEKVTLTALDVCSMMILLKQARLANNPTHRDSMIDTAGYVELADIISSKTAVSSISGT